MDELISIGAGGRVALNKVVAVGRWDSAPTRRAVRKARQEGRLIDLTFGRACRWVFFMDTGHIILGTEMAQENDELVFEK